MVISFAQRTSDAPLRRSDCVKNLPQEKPYPFG